MKSSVLFVVVAFAISHAQQTKQAERPATIIIGYVRDAGCVHRFPQVVKPLPNGCLQACVRARSPLVVLTKDQEVYHPVSSQMPDNDVRQKLLPYAGKLVKITGHVYERGGSRAISLERIDTVKE